MVPALSGTAKYGNWSEPVQPVARLPRRRFVRARRRDVRRAATTASLSTWTLGELLYNSAAENGAEFVFEARMPSSSWATPPAA